MKRKFVEIVIVFGLVLIMLMPTLVSAWTFQDLKDWFGSIFSRFGLFAALGENCVNDAQCDSGNCAYWHGVCCYPGQECTAFVNKADCVAECTSGGGTTTTPTTSPTTSPTTTVWLCYQDSDCIRYCSSYPGWWANCNPYGQCFFNTMRLSGYDYQCPTDVTTTVSTTTPTTTPTTQPTTTIAECSSNSQCCDEFPEYGCSGVPYAECTNGKCWFYSNNPWWSRYKCPCDVTTTTTETTTPTTIPTGDQCTVDEDCSKFCESFPEMYGDCSNGYCFFNTMKLSGYDFQCPKEGDDTGYQPCGKAVRAEFHDLDTAKDYCDSEHICWILWWDCNKGQYWKCEYVDAKPTVVLHTSVKNDEVYDHDYEMACGIIKLCNVMNEECGIGKSLLPCCEGLVCWNNVCQEPGTLPKKAENQPCESDEECQEGLKCLPWGPLGLFGKKCQDPSKVECEIWDIKCHLNKLINEPFFWVLIIVIVLFLIFSPSRQSPMIVVGGRG